MYGLSLEVIERVRARQGRLHPFSALRGERCALVVVDMQNYFVKPGFQAEVPAARDIVPQINRAARSMRTHGGTLAWVQTASDGADASWTWLHRHMYTPERSERRLAELAQGSEGFALWHELQALPQDLRITKKRFSAFIQGSSDIDAHLRRLGIDTLLIAGTTTNVCCESTARDAMMLNYKVVMVHDALAAYTDAEHNATLATFYMIFGDVQSVDDVTASIQRGLAHGLKTDAASPHRRPKREAKPPAS